jgi:hypothetical protein
MSPSKTHEETQERQAVYLLLPSDFRAALMQYLSTKPWGEVHQAQAELANLKKAEIENA